MARITITIDTDNAAFLDNPSEAYDILKRNARHIGPEPKSIPLRDSNGNTVGQLTVTE